MLDLIPDAFADVDTRFFEPAAGNGNFLEAILLRKISAIAKMVHGGTDHWYEFALLRCLAAIYGVDISEENVFDARARLRSALEGALIEAGEVPTPGFATAVSTILLTNIVVGDSLNAAHEISFVEYIPLDAERFQRNHAPLEEPDVDLFYSPPAELPVVHYSGLR